MLMVRHISLFNIDQVAARKEQLTPKVIELPVSSANVQPITRKKEFSYFYGLGGRFNLVLVYFLC